jgi:hypothetical protein
MNRIDKTQWQETLQHYKKWNDDVFFSSIRNAGEKSIEQKWLEFLSIMEFGLMIKHQPSEHEQKQKANMLNAYYEQIEYFEMRRSQNRKSV